MSRYLDPYKVFRDGEGNYVFAPIPLATYDADFAEMVGHEQAAAQAVEVLADELIELADMIRSGEFELDITEEELDPDYPDDEYDDYYDMDQ